VIFVTEGSWLRKMLSIYNHNDVLASQHPYRKIRAIKRGPGSCNKACTLRFSENSTGFRARAEGMEDGIACCLRFACFGAVIFPLCQVGSVILIYVVDSIAGMSTRNQRKPRHASSPRTFGAFMLSSKWLLKRRRALRL